MRIKPPYIVNCTHTHTLNIKTCVCRSCFCMRETVKPHILNAFRYVYMGKMGGKGDGKKPQKYSLNLKFRLVNY